MATISTHSSLLISLMNQTLADFNSSSSLTSNEYFLHLFILISVWFILIITILCGTIGNLLVLYVYTNRSDNKTCTFFIKILAIVDLIICLLLAPLELYQITVGIRNEFICKFYGYLNTHVLYSTFLITIIAFDRYFCICWPLYRIITIDRARSIVIICGIITSILAIIPMREYSTMEHVLHLHNNHTKYLQIDNLNSFDLPDYAHVEHLKGAALVVLPFTIGNITNVKCSPRFSLHVQYSTFLNIYRLFHTTLFVLCILTVLILYSFIYNAIYQRRRSRIKKFSRYRAILQSYLIPSNSSSFKTRSSLCCWKNFSSNSSSSSPSSIEYLSRNQTCQIKPMSNHIILEVQGARGKRYSAISMTSMTYFTSGVWDETSTSNAVRSRMNSITANHFCGTEQTITDESVLPLRPSLHLTVPTFQTNAGQDQQKDENETRKSIVRKPSQNLSIRQSRPSDLFVQQRKVSFMTTTNQTELIDQCITEDPMSTNENNNNDNQQQQDELRNSIYSTRRFSVFDNETKRIFDRQQRQERLANIRTTLTLFIVTATFILMYLPSIVISLFNIKPNEFREVLFLLYYINSACNPLIYSFFNVNFRNDIRRIYECQKREYLARQ